MLKFLLFVFFSILVITAFGQQATVTGRIADVSGSAIPFVSVYVKGTSISTVGNERGFYKLKLDSGDYELVFRCVGYKQLEKDLKLHHDKVVNAELESEVKQLQEIKIYAHSSDFVNAVVRKAIARRRFYLKQSSFFLCDAYTKGVQKLVRAPKRFLGKDVVKVLSLDSSRQSILYQSETLSKLYVKGDEIKEVMVASKVAGDKQGFSFNRALDVKANFYNNLLQWSNMSKQSFVSPIADNAFSYYNYSLEGIVSINGHTIYKIRVLPKGKYDPVFKGYIYILKDHWRLYSIDLQLTRNARIEFVDSLKVTQQFVELKKNLWQPSDITFRFYGKVLGFEFAAYLIGIYSNYELNPKTPSGFFNNEIVKINDDANKLTNEFWLEKRPVPLTNSETLNYIQKDSLERRKKDKQFLDSIQRKTNKFNLARYVVAGYKRNDFYHRSFWYFYPLHSSVFYNNIEGWGVNLRARYKKQDTDKKWWEFEPNLRYGFTSRSLNLNAEVTYQYDTLNHASVTVKGGSDFLDLNNRGTINLFYNTLATLFEGKNYLKLYRANFVSFRTQRQLAEGFMATAGMEIARRIPVRNASYNWIFDNAQTNFSGNKSFARPGADPFPVNNAFVVEFKTSYTYGQKYTSKPDGKVYEAPRYPTFQIDYRKGLKNIMGSAVDYDFVSVDIFQDKIRLGLMGYSSFYFSAGKFLNTNSLYFPDLRHFTGNQTAVYNPLFPNYHFLDYYAFSTDQKYIEGHYEHNFTGLAFSKIPLIRRLKLEEIIGGAILNEPKRTYKEVYFGLQRLVFRVDYGFSWSTGRKVNHAFRIFYGF